MNSSDEMTRINSIREVKLRAATREGSGVDQMSDAGLIRTAAETRILADHCGPLDPAYGHLDALARRLTRVYFLRHCIRRNLSAKFEVALEPHILRLGPVALCCTAAQALDEAVSSESNARAGGFDRGMHKRASDHWLELAGVLEKFTHELGPTAELAPTA